VDKVPKAGDKWIKCNKLLASAFSGFVFDFEREASGENRKLTSGGEAGACCIALPMRVEKLLRGITIRAKN
jgi:hypothetical protein